MNNLEIVHQGIKTQLLINNTNENDSGNYSCKASNIYGHSKYNILHQVKSTVFY